MIATAQMTQHIADFDLYGIVGIRVIADRPQDCELVAATLGPIQKPLTRSPDITVRFVDRIETDTPLNLVGGHDCGFSGNKFFVTRGKNKASIRVQVPFDSV